MAQSDDDMIADPNEALFTDDNFSPKLVMNFMASMSRATAQNQNMIRAIGQSVNALVDAENARQVSEAKSDARFEAIEKENAAQRRLLEKYLTKTDNLTHTINDSCDLNIKHNTNYTDKEIDKVLRYVKIGAVTAIALGAVIYYDIKDAIKLNDKHTRDTTIHKVKK